MPSPPPPPPPWPSSPSSPSWPSSPPRRSWPSSSSPPSSPSSSSAAPRSSSRLPPPCSSCGTSESSLRGGTGGGTARPPGSRAVGPERGGEAEGWGADAVGTADADGRTADGPGAGPSAPWAGTNTSGPRVGDPSVPVHTRPTVIPATTQKQTAMFSAPILRIPIRPVWWARPRAGPKRRRLSSGGRRADRSPRQAQTGRPPLLRAAWLTNPAPMTRNSVPPTRYGVVSTLPVAASVRPCAPPG